MGSTGYASVQLRLIGHPAAVDAALAALAGLPTGDVAAHRRKPARSGRDEQILYGHLTVGVLAAAGPAPGTHVVDEAVVEDVAQTMRDANSPDAWTHGPQIMPMGHFAAAALARVAELGRLLPAGGHVKRWWRVRYEQPGAKADVTGTTDDHAEALAAYATAVQLGFTATLQTRHTRTFPDGSMHTGPWHTSEVTL